MRINRITHALLGLLIIAMASACNSFVVENVDYSQQLESVLVPDENGNVTDVRHGISFNVNSFKQQEFGESDSTKQIREIRLIRNADGFYFITANQFTNVYVMEPGKGSLKMKKKIKVSESPLNEPAFNLRSSGVQLVMTDSNEVLELNENGIEETEEEEQS
ncbi:hypothetical protein [Gracilimonas amylolytica]|uniref:hypothetical protein n=1 Tax=Gracilimonas amylolytica TaxID=1749045 RepID=UPI000CD872DE|nr:hypothetical protein [Gracilimonas amylolytica]